MVLTFFPEEVVRRNLFYSLRLHVMVTTLLSLLLLQWSVGRHLIRPAVLGMSVLSSPNKSDLIEKGPIVSH
ncbi:hypothetical protein EDC04DRAFT_2680021 [Pisolithus marmoratus]|nr:hypothetical protein EDC04DRAFT_2680021 [Pisolithus marmoratus]